MQRFKLARKFAAPENAPWDRVEARSCSGACSDEVHAPRAVGSHLYVYDDRPTRVCAARDPNSVILFIFFLSVASPRSEGARAFCSFRAAVVNVVERPPNSIATRLLFHWSARATHRLRIRTGETRFWVKHDFSNVIRLPISKPGRVWTLLKQTRFNYVWSPKCPSRDLSGSILTFDLLTMRITTSCQR
jgi:hypothetical protein